MENDLLAYFKTTHIKAAGKIIGSRKIKYFTRKRENTLIGGYFMVFMVKNHVICMPVFAFTAVFGIQIRHQGTAINIRLVAVTYFVKNVECPGGFTISNNMVY